MTKNKKNNMQETETKPTRRNEMIDRHDKKTGEPSFTMFEVDVVADGTTEEVVVESVNKEQAGQEALRHMKEACGCIDNQMHVSAVRECHDPEKVAIPRYECPHCALQANGKPNDPFLDDIMDSLITLVNGGYLFAYQKNCRILPTIDNICSNGNGIQITLSEPQCCKTNCSVRADDHN